MKKFRTTHSLVLLSLVAALLLTALAPPPAQAALAGENDKDLVRLTIKNRNPKSLYLKLSGTNVYSITVQGETTERFTIERGTYSYWFTGCGMTATGTIEINANKIFVMAEVCGGNAGKAGNLAHKVDLSTKLKIVPVSIENDTATNALVILTGPSTYVFTFKKGQTRDFTIARGSFTVKYYACGKVGTRDFEANKGSSLVLACPK